MSHVGPALKELAFYSKHIENITNFVSISFCLGTFATIVCNAYRANIEILKDMKCPRTLRMVRAQKMVVWVLLVGAHLRLKK